MLQQLRTYNEQVRQWEEIIARHTRLQTELREERKRMAVLRNSILSLIHVSTTYLSIDELKQEISNAVHVSGTSAGAASAPALYEMLQRQKRQIADLKDENAMLRSYQREKDEEIARLSML